MENSISLYLKRSNVERAAIRVSQTMIHLIGHSKTKEMASDQNIRQLLGDCVYYSRMLCEEVIFVTYVSEIVSTVIIFHESITSKNN